MASAVLSVSALCSTYVSTVLYLLFYLNRFCGETFTEYGNLREEEWSKLDYLSRDASHRSNQIELSKGMAQEHFVSPCLTHIVNRPVAMWRY